MKKYTKKLKNVLTNIECLYILKLQKQIHIDEQIQRKEKGPLAT